MSDLVPHYFKQMAQFYGFKQINGSVNERIIGVHLRDSKREVDQRLAEFYIEADFSIQKHHDCVCASLRQCSKAWRVELVLGRSIIRYNLLGETEHFLIRNGSLDVYLVGREKKINDLNLPTLPISVQLNASHTFRAGYQPLGSKKLIHGPWEFTCQIALPHRYLINACNCLMKEDSQMPHLLRRFYEQVTIDAEWRIKMFKQSAGWIEVDRQIVSKRVLDELTVNS